MSKSPSILFPLPTWFSVVLTVLLLGGCQQQANAPASSEPPNVIFILTDDQRFDMMGNMNPLLHTPEMDRLVAEGVRFENAFVTTAICAASRASLLTGMVERTHGFTFGTPPLDSTFTAHSYPQQMRAAGYRTGFVGKFGVSVEEGATDAMFDVFTPLRPNPYFKPQPDGTVRHLTDVTGDEAIQFIASTPANQPFMLSISFNAPHAEDGDERQYLWPEAMNSLYRDITLPAPPLADPAFHEALPSFMKDPEVNMNRYRWFWRFDTPEKAQAMTKGYFRMISGIDAVIGRIRDALTQHHRADQTVIILMGDNGYFLGERGYAGKWLPHEPSIRVPLVVYDPRTATYAGQRPTAMALNIDITPTLLDLAGLPMPPGVQGRSLLPLLQDAEPEDWRTDIWIEHLMDHPQIIKHEGIRTAQYKYSRYFERDPLYEELYDLNSDPLETTNLVDDPDYAQTLAALRARTNEVRDQYGGPYSPPPRNP